VSNSLAELAPPTAAELAALRQLQANSTSR
jgi:hypothetical protein